MRSYGPNFPNLSMRSTGYAGSEHSGTKGSSLRPALQGRIAPKTSEDLR